MHLPDASPLCSSHRLDTALSPNLRLRLMMTRSPRATRSSVRPRPASPPAPAPSRKRRKTARAASQQPVPQPEPQLLATADPPPSAASHPVIRLDGQPLYPDCHAVVPYAADRAGALAPHLIRIVTWNVCSLRSISSSGAFASYVERERPHILCLQETKMNAEVAEAFDPPAGYDLFWNHSQSRKGYSGVAVFIRTDTISANKDTQQDEDDTQPDDTQSNDGNNADSVKMLSVVSVDYAIGDVEADAEGRIITVQLQQTAGEAKAAKKNKKINSKKRICLVVAYVPNVGGKLARLSYRTDVFERKMRDYLKSLADQNMSVIYCGDLNVAYQEIDIHNSKSNKKSAGHTPEERKAFGQLLEHGPQWIDCYRALWPNYRGFTYFSRRFGTRLKLAGKGWRLDYFLVDKATYDDKKLCIADCFVRPDVEGSDHYPLVLDIDLNK